MSDPKIIDNPMFEKDSNSLQSVQFKSTEGQRLIGPDINPVKNFAQDYARRFYALKLVNCILLFFTAVLSTVGALYCLRISRWSNWHMKTALPRISDGQLVRSESLAILAWIMFFLATFSLVMYHRKKKTVENSKMFLASLAVTDICLSFFCLLNLVFIFVSYGLRATSEYLWFYPRLMNGTSLQVLTESHWGGYTRDYYKPYQRQYYKEYEATTPPTMPSSTFSPYMMWEMGTRKREIIIRLFLDPAVVIIALLAILVNIVYITLLRKTIKRNSLWASNFREAYPESSKLSVSYAEWSNFVSKLLNWVFPVFLILAPIYRITFIHAWIFFCGTGICFAVCFYQWISYIQKVKFRIGELSSSEHEKSIAKDIKQDLVLCCIGSVFYMVLYSSYWPYELIQKVSLAALFLFLCCTGNNFYMLYKHGGLTDGMNLKILPRISISISVNVVKESETSAEQSTGNSKSDGQEKKEKPEENKTEKDLCEKV
ncbi:hypothetical protein DdX_14421 [Ditylenchus destructor]|uniref:Uncharacterized protein n=1 Tax=Ditylenchus destructor TaxID=166010 RepID=A0AAD4MRV6_9BILA|nr:hypothetical protein DdX_14421 [Ditylenchus destructor]